MSLAFTLLPHRGVIAVGGEDRAEFLQGLISNDTTKVAPGQAIWAALLTPQGRFLNDMFVADGGDGTLLIETERERAPALAKKLTLYKLRSKVTVEDRSSTMEVAVVFGSGVEKLLPLDGAFAFVDPRLPELGVRVLTAAGQAASLLAAHGAQPAPVEAYEKLRLSLGVPDGSRDLLPEKALLLESGFDELNGVDWQKGCYMGQELTARTKYRGLVKKRLFPVKIEGPLPAPGAAIERDGQEVGEIRSGAGDRAIALLRLDAVRAAGPLTSGETRIQPEVPAWMRLPEPVD
ncbi:MAG: folate-binding protein YgfZ [Alphaproteobacteria bacterium]|nr:folate-binding protein YgfZ [Alphaproteobacteria bacterium]